MFDQFIVTILWSIMLVIKLAQLATFALELVALHTVTEFLVFFEVESELVDRSGQI